MVILISEDDADVRNVMEYMLKFHGDTVYSVGDGKAALELLEAGTINFDILITDFNMPQMNGDVLIREIFKKNIQLKKIIMMTGQVSNDGAIQSLVEEHSNVSFLSKPVGEEKLLKAIS